MEISKTGFQATLSWKSLIFIPAVFLLAGWLLNTPEGLLGKADAVGYAVCHRIDVRSFYLGERQLPLCVRCSGMYLGAMLGLAFQGLIAGRKSSLPPRRVVAVMALLLAAFGVDGLNSYLHLFPGAPGLYEPQNFLRLLTGTGMGLNIALVLYPAFNQTVWKDWQPLPAVSSLRTLGVMVVLALLLDALLLTGNPLLLYPLALISAGGVLVLLTMVYTMVVLMALRRENRYLLPAQLVLPLVSGFTIGLAQIILFDLARFLLTGTWDGFHLG